eukprot:2493947-Prymnesium_polylepis.1
MAFAAAVSSAQRAQEPSSNPWRKAATAASCKPEAQRHGLTPSCATGVDTARKQSKGANHLSSAVRATAAFQSAARSRA